MKLMVIEWEDASGGMRQGWRQLSDMPCKAQKAISVGWVIQDSLQATTIVPHVSGNEGDGEITIPAGWILSKRVIE